MYLSFCVKRALVPKTIVHPSETGTEIERMSTQRYLVFAEIEFWRDTLRISKGDLPPAKLESIHQALILAQNKLFVLDMTMPSFDIHDVISVAYH